MSIQAPGKGLRVQIPPGYSGEPEGAMAGSPGQPSSSGLGSQVDRQNEETQDSLASRVGMHVDSQVVVPVEGPATLGALIGTFTSVDALVTKEVRGPAEDLATVGTGRPALLDARVLTLVQYQGLPPLEGEQAFATVVNLSS